MVIHFEIDGLLRNRELREQETMPIDVIYVHVQQIRHLRDIFALQRNKIKKILIAFSPFWIKVFQHYTRRGLLFQLFLDFIQQELSSKLLAIYLVFLYVLRPQSFTRFQGLSRNEKNIFCHSLRTWLIARESFKSKYYAINSFWGAFENYGIPDYSPFSRLWLLSCE